MYKIFFKDRYVSLGESPLAAKEDVLNVHYKSDKALGELLGSFAGNETMARLHLVHSDLDALRNSIRSLFTCIDAGGGVVYNAQGAYLAILRNGMWDLPKGKLDRGEGFEEAALREVEEECGLKELVLKQLLTSTFHTYAMGKKQVLKETRWYEMHYPGTDAPVLQAEEGITGSRWVRAGEDREILENTYASIRDVLSLKYLRERA